ncbi:Bcr/CflA family drug resistance efflux transporter, partial [Yersinia enterocolitica]|nr:Bcr/CflA family drug resistance efflux transporter [Yersinia enterocolitica]
GLGLLAIALPIEPKLSLAIVMLAGCLLAWQARRASKNVRGKLQKIN